MGRKADDTCEKFNELHFSHSKGIALWVFQPSKLMTCTDQQSKSQDSQVKGYDNGETGPPEYGYGTNTQKLYELSQNLLDLLWCSKKYA